MDCDAKKGIQVGKALQREHSSVSVCWDNASFLRSQARDAIISYDAPV